LISEAVLLYFERKIVVSGAKNVLAYRIPDLVRSPLAHDIPQAVFGGKLLLNIDNYIITLTETKVRVF